MSNPIAVQADRVRELAALLEGTSILLLELTTPDGTFRLRRDTGGAPTPMADAALIGIPAPSVGIFQATHPLLKTPLANPGRTVVAGDVVGLVQVGALLLHVVAPADGVLQDLLVADGETVGYGTPLMRLAPR